jgi:hypothetical protein
MAVFFYGTISDNTVTKSRYINKFGGVVKLDVKHPKDKVREA